MTRKDSGLTIGPLKLKLWLSMIIPTEPIGSIPRPPELYHLTKPIEFQKLESVLREIRP